MLRRYFAGYTLFGDFMLQTVEDGVALRGSALRRVLHAQAVLFERLLLAVFGEYTGESQNGHRPEQRQADRVKKLLAGEPVEPGALGYEFDDWHVGAVACGVDAASALRDLADAADRRLLLIKPETGTVWAWFGGRRRIAVAEFAQRVTVGERGDMLVALGEPARGLEGWRLTHQQASAALWVARDGDESVVRYADVGLLASIARDRVLANSLRLLYLAPLADGRDGGLELRNTLRAYFTAGRNITSAASALGVSRQTVGNRLRVIEEKLGRTIESCAPEIEVALRLD
ncbi:MAG TPA: helix-turn-helix domain-containing protein [Solirubrobacterales bacterium]